MEGIVLLVKSEEMQYPDDPQHPEYHHSREEEYGDYGKEADDSVKGYHELQSGAHAPLLREQKIRRPYPEHILHTEEDRGDDLDRRE